MEETDIAEDFSVRTRARTNDSRKRGAYTHVDAKNCSEKREKLQRKREVHFYETVVMDSTDGRIFQTNLSCFRLIPV